MKILLLLFTASLFQFTNSKPFYVHILVNANKEIKIENKTVSFDKLDNAVKTILEDSTLQNNEQVIIQIYGDENLKMGYITDVQGQILKLSPYKGIRFKRELYLLDTKKERLDQSGWINRVQQFHLKPVK
ncbi:hypothetical protein ACG2LH_05295 [Zhouia sp. PK063]|uniref:hypothetical protein n=1 Tax=Zhouia sp. PK063 TaxID=3373602 RepID=UPI0037AFAEFA